VSQVGWPGTARGLAAAARRKFKVRGAEPSEISDDDIRIMAKFHLVPPVGRSLPAVLIGRLMRVAQGMNHYQGIGQPSSQQASLDEGFRRRPFHHVRRSAPSALFLGIPENDSKINASME
jgi:hypothetical protein